MRQLLPAAMVLAFLACGASFGAPIKLPDAPVEILADQATQPGRWVMDSAGSKSSLGSLRDELQVEISPRGQVQFGIFRPIPVLFTYSLELKPTVPTSNFNVAVSFLDSIKGFGAPPAAVKSAMIAMRSTPIGCPSYAGVDLCKTREAASNLAAFRTLARDAISAAMVFDEGRVKDYATQFKEFTESLPQLEKDLATIDAADLRAALGGNLTLAQERTRWQSAGGDTAPIEAAIALIARRTDISSAIRFAVEFSTEYQNTFTTEYLTSSLRYETASDRPIELIVAPNAKFADVFPADAKAFQQARVGTFKAVAKPFERLSLSIGAGVLYSFVRDPAFSVGKNDAGELLIAKSEDDYAEFEGAVVLNVTGDGWKAFGVHPFFQLGLAPSSQNLAVLAGAGLQMFDRGAVSLGAIYQRVDRLAPGLTEGSVIDSPEALVTKKEFKPGMYLMLSINLK